MARRAKHSPEAAEAWAASLIGARGTVSALTEKTRGPVRFWLTSNGLPSAFVRGGDGFPGLTMATLCAAWNDTTNETLESLRRLASETASTTAAQDDTTTTTTEQDDMALQESLAMTRGTRTTTTTTTTTTAPEAATQLATLIAQMAGGAIDENKVRAIVDEQAGASIAAASRHVLENVKTELTSALEKIATAQKIEIEVKDHTGTVRNVGRQHKTFPRLLKMAAARRNVWLRGPAGSGKTTAARMVAEALGLAFYFTGAIDTEYKLLGFTDAQGRIVKRQFREAWENGGVFLFDEVDASLPNAVLALNAALANAYCDFPDGCIPKHPDCIIIAAANTYGLGADATYVGRMRQDGAFLDRFVKLDWAYDEELERATCPNAAWCAHVQAIRANVTRQGLQVIVSPRASYDGAALLAHGLTWDETEEATLRGAMTTEQWRSVAIDASARKAA